MVGAKGVDRQRMNKKEEEKKREKRHISSTIVKRERGRKLLAS